MWGVTVLTDIVLPANFLEDVDLLHGRLSDLFDLLWSCFVRWGDVDDLHRILLRRLFADAATHHTAHSPREEKTRRPSYRQLCQVTYFIRSLYLRSWICLCASLKNFANKLKVSMKHDGCTSISYKSV